MIKGKCGTDCDIYKCATTKSFEHCGECKKLPCKTLTEYIENGHNPYRLSNLIKWRNEIIDTH